MAGSFTVEAALVLLLVLGILGGVISLALRWEKSIRQEALTLEEERINETELSPVDLIRLLGFLEEWIPED